MVLLLYIMKIYFDTDRYVILDSCFCILKGLIQLKKKGVFECAFINKIRYGTSMVPVKEMEDHFGEVGMGGEYAIKGIVYDVI